MPGPPECTLHKDLCLFSTLKYPKCLEHSRYSVNHVVFQDGVLVPPRQQKNESTRGKQPQTSMQEALPVSPLIALPGCFRSSPPPRGGGGGGSQISPKAEAIHIPIHIPTGNVPVFLQSFFFFWLFGAIPLAYGSFQARG